MEDSVGLYADRILVGPGKDTPAETKPPEFNYLPDNGSLPSSSDVLVVDVSSTEWFKERVVAPDRPTMYTPNPAKNPHNYDSVHEKLQADKRGRAGPLPGIQTLAPDWSTEFLNLVAEPDSDTKYTSLAHLANNFVHTAKSYGKIIIEEYHLPPHKKTIPPANVSGQAGGQKYITHNILFKFATDWKGYYGGDEYAMKAAGHELKGLMSVFQCQLPALSVPLMCLLDYRGYRLSASSLLPIQPPASLVYGSEDGGLTVAAADGPAAELMQRLAQRLNLARHYAARSGQQVYGPTDLELHRVGAQYFMLDFARLFPPEPPVRNGASLYNLLRPELVRMSPEPLSSDAFTAFGVEEKLAGERPIRALLAELPARCRAFAAVLEDRRRGVADNIELVTRLHRAGLNIRHLGAVRQHVASAAVRRMLLVEMLARVAKAHLQQKMRDLMRVLQFALKANFVEDTAAYLNVLLGEPGAPATQTFWGSIMKAAVLQKWGPDALDAGEQAASLRPPSITPLLRRLEQVAGLRLSDSAYRELELVEFESEGFELVGADIAKLAEKTKHMNLVEYAEGTALVLQSRSARSQTQQTRLFELGLKRYEAAVLSKPDDYLTLGAWARATWDLYLKRWELYRGHPPGMAPSNGLFETAVSKWALAADLPALLGALETVLGWAESEGTARYVYERIKAALAEAEAHLGPRYETAAIRVRVHQLLSHWGKGGRRRAADCAKAGQHYRALLAAYPERAAPVVLAAARDLSDLDLGSLHRVAAHASGLDSLDAAWLLPDGLRAPLLEALGRGPLAAARLKAANLGDAVFLRLVETRPPLQHLNLVGTQVSAASVRQLLDTWPGLRTLRLSCALSEELGEALGRLTQLTALRLDCSGLAGAFLARAPPSLEHLALHNCQGVPAGAWEPLARLTQLHSLRLTWASELRAKALLPLAAAMPHLHQLRLQYVQLPLPALEQLLRARLRLLDVTGNIFVSPGELAKLQQLHPAVRIVQAAAAEEDAAPVLRLPANSTKEQVVRLTGQLSRSTTVTDVIVQNARNFGPNFETLLVGLSATKCAALRKLSISHSPLSPEQSFRLADVLAQNRAFHLDTLELSHCELAPASAERIVQGFAGRHLSLAGVRLGGPACEALGQLLARRQLASLCLARCHIGDEGVRLLVAALADNPDNQALELDLSACDVGVQGAVHLGFCLGNDPYLAGLHLADNQLGALGMRALGAGLQYNDWLTSLNVAGNGITDDGLREFLRGLKENWRLEALVLDRNQLGDQAFGLLFAHLHPRARLRHLSALEQARAFTRDLFEYLAGFMMKRKEVWKLSSTHFVFQVTLAEADPALRAVVARTYCEVFRAGAELHIQPQALGDQLRHQATALYEDFLASRRSEERHVAQELSLTLDPGLSANLRRHLEVKKKGDQEKEAAQARLVQEQEARRKGQWLRAQAAVLAAQEAAALDTRKVHWKRHEAQLVRAQAVVRGWLVRRSASAPAVPAIAPASAAIAPASLPSAPD